MQEKKLSQYHTKNKKMKQKFEYCLGRFRLYRKLFLVSPSVRVPIRTHDVLLIRVVGVLR